VVDDCDLIFEFGVGRNFDVQDKDPDCLRHHRLQCQRGQVVLFVYVYNIACHVVYCSMLLYVCTYVVIVTEFTVKLRP